MLIAGWAAAASAQTVFVSNEKDNTLSVIDAKSLEVVRTIDVGKRPRGITLGPDFKTLYVCASDDNRVEMFDTATLRKVGELPSGIDPEQFFLHPDGHHLYIANENDNVVTVVDTATRHVVAQVDVGVEPEGHGGQPRRQDRRQYLRDDQHGALDRYHDLPVHRQHAGRPAAALRPVQRRRQAALGVLGDRRHRRGDRRRRRARSSRPSPSRFQGVHKDRVQPVGIKLTSDGKYAFVALGPANHVAVVDREDLRGRCRTCWSAVGYGNMALSPDEKLLFTTNGISNDVSVIDVPTLKAIKSIKVGRYPWGVAIKP